MANSRNRPSPDLFSRIDSTLTTHCPPGSRLLLGFSGGIDSTVLLHALAFLRGQHGWRVECAHVHHGLSPHADAWAEACAAQCRALDIPFELLRVDVPRSSPDGLECAARHARYRALHAQARAHACDVLLTGHHADDQAETLLHNMVRGAGLLGLAGMPLWRASSAEGVAMLRPLLGVSRATLESTARDAGFSWMEDESNEDTRFARNYLRHEVMPRLVGRWPRAAETMAGVARRLAEAQSLIDEVAAGDAEALSMLGVWGRCYRLEGLIALAVPRQRNLLRWLLRSHGARTLPNEAWLDEWLRQIRHARHDVECPVTHAGVAAFCHRGALWLVPDEAPSSEAEWDGSLVMKWGAGDLRFDTADGRGLASDLIGRVRFSVRSRLPGDRLRRGPARPRASVKQIAQESGLPPWLRDRAPILCLDGQPVWMPGCEIAPPHAAVAGKPGLLPIWTPILS